MSSGWSAASKNSGPSTLARMASGSAIEIDATCAEPSSESASPPGSARSVAVTSASEPRNQKTPECRTANANVELTALAWKVPVRGGVVEGGDMEGLTGRGAPV